MDSVRLSFYCPGCEPGYHMPYLRAAENGLFEQHGLDVELLEPAPKVANIMRVADGGADFCLTSVAYFVKARAQRADLPARFAGVITQRSPMAAVVLEDSPIQGFDDLAPARVGGRGEGGLLTEYLGALAHLGIATPEVVEVAYEDAPAALRDKAIDVMGDFVDLQPKLRHTAGPIRALPFGIDVYASGLVAADRRPLELVVRVRAAVVEALAQHADAPERGVSALVERYPDANANDALEGWRLIAPLIFTERAVGSMTEEGWQRSLAYAAAVHGAPVPDAERVFRPELLEAPQPV
ncbi:MAG: ABC transporter substrate-binding protein [Candidatus Dormibacteria bacterium]